MAFTQGMGQPVIFDILEDCYCPGSEITVRFSILPGFTPCHEDRVALMEADWTTTSDAICFQELALYNTGSHTTGTAHFNAKQLVMATVPDGSGYQFLYITSKDKVAGRSTVFCFGQQVNTVGSFECISNAASEEFTIISPLSDLSCDLSCDQVSDGSSDFELIKTQNSDHETLAHEFILTNERTPFNFILDGQEKRNNECMSLVLYGQRAVIPYKPKPIYTMTNERALKFVPDDEPATRHSERTSVISYGQRVVMPYEPKPIYSVAYNKPAATGLCSPQSTLYLSFPETNKPVTKINMGELYPPIPLTDVSKKQLNTSNRYRKGWKMCSRCKRYRQRLLKATRATTKSRRELHAQQTKARELDNQLLIKTTQTDQLSETIRELACDHSKLVTINDQLHEQLQEAAKVSEDAAELRQDNKQLRQEVSDLLSTVHILEQDKQEFLEAQQGNDWTPVSSKRTERLAHQVTLQQKSIRELQQERQLAQDKVWTAEAELSKLQVEMSTLQLEKDSDISTLRTENEELFHKIQSLEVKYQDMKDSLHRERRKQSETMTQHQIRESELQSRIQSLKDALESAQLISKKRTADVATLTKGNLGTRRPRTSGLKEDPRPHIPSCNSAKSSDETLDSMPIPDIASGTQIDLSFAATSSSSSSLKCSEITEESRAYSPSKYSQPSITKRSENSQNQTTKDFTKKSKKPRKFHFKAVNPSKASYPLEYTPRIYGRAPNKSSEEKASTAVKQSCPHCLMTFPSGLDSIRIQRHIQLHQSRL